MVLSADAYNGLSKLASKTGMDCWFWILTVNNQDVVYDLENQCVIPWPDALADMCITGPLGDYGLSQPEIDEIIKLLEYFQLI